MKHTPLYDVGYRYYVYIGPGNVHYFYTLPEAITFQQQHGGTLGEVT